MSSTVTPLQSHVFRENFLSSDFKSYTKNTDIAHGGYFVVSHCVGERELCILSSLTFDRLTHTNSFIVMMM